MGKRVMGKILGMGSERGMGTNNTACLFRTAAPKIYQALAEPEILSSVHAPCIPHRPNDLFRCKLYSWRHAFVCVICYLYWGGVIVPKISVYIFPVFYDFEAVCCITLFRFQFTTIPSYRQEGGLFVRLCTSLLCK